MKVRKFIVIEDKKGEPHVRLGYVEFHRHLLNKGEDGCRVLGGGKYRVNGDEDNKYVLLYGRSDDFGDIPDIKTMYEALTNTDIADTISFSEDSIRRIEGDGEPIPDGTYRVIVEYPNDKFERFNDITIECGD